MPRFMFSAFIISFAWTTAAMIWISALAATFALHLGLSACQSTGFAGCDVLRDAGLGDSLLLPSGPDGDYSRALSGYWTAASSNLNPWCILQPNNAAEVSEAIKALSSIPESSGRWHIGLKGGGHSHWNNNNVAHGVTIDLARLNTTTVRNATSADGVLTHVASIGAGSKWTDVLQITERHGLAVAGGRVGTVGVSGLILGGGVSFYSGYRGFSCDNIVNFELVLADGSLVNANENDNPSLWKALKGGGTNFGIVTRFDMVAFPAGPLYGGILTSTWQHRDVYNKNFLRMIQDSNAADSQILLWQHAAGSAEPTVGSLPVNVDGQSNSTIFTALNEVPVVYKMLGEFTYGQLISSNSVPSGMRNVWYSICFRAVPGMLGKSEELLMKLIHNLNDLPYADETMNTMFSFQSMPKSWAYLNPEGNVLGVDESLQEDSLLFLAQTAVTSQEMEAFFQTRLAAITAELESYAESINAATPFRYLNYVHPSQKPFQSYGAANIDFMKRVAAEYDPSGFFQTRVSGGFKISDVK